MSSILHLQCKSFEFCLQEFWYCYQLCRFTKLHHQSGDISLKYGDIAIIKLAIVCHLEFQNLKNFTQTGY